MTEGRFTAKTGETEKTSERCVESYNLYRQNLREAQMFLILPVFLEL
jgi:hypothetical protein